MAISPPSLLGKYFHQRRSKVALGKNRYLNLTCLLSVYFLGACALSTQQHNASDRTGMLNSLASIYHKESVNFNADSKLKPTSENGKQTLGADDPRVAKSLSMMGWLYTFESNYSEKLTELVGGLTKGSQSVNTSAGINSLDKSTVASNQNNPNSNVITESIAMGLDNLANIYAGQAKYSDAEPLYKRALSVLEKAFGSNHVALLPVLDDYIHLLEKTNRQSEAALLKAQAATIRATHRQTK